MLGHKVGKRGQKFRRQITGNGQVHVLPRKFAAAVDKHFFTPREKIRERKPSAPRDGQHGIYTFKFRLWKKRVKNRRAQLKRYAARLDLKARFLNAQDLQRTVADRQSF